MERRKFIKSAGLIGDKLGADGASFTVEYNLFERAHEEGVEIVSLKSNYNLNS